MGLSASQARFLQLTARKSNIEYQAQRINFERLQLSDKAAAASAKYNEKMSNQKLTYTFNSGNGRSTVDLTYTNYKNYMNMQLDGQYIAADQKFLVSSSGNKIVVANEQEMADMIARNNKTLYFNGTADEVKSAKEAYAKAQEEGTTVSPRIEALAKVTLDPVEVDEDGNEVASDANKKYQGEYVKEFTPKDFLIADDLDNVENFQKAIREGIYYFATFGVQEGEDSPRFRTEDWGNLEGGSISEEYDKSDDAAAQAEYDSVQTKIQSMDKKLELQLDKLNTEREAIQTELESVKKVIDDNVESSFKTFS